MSELSEFILDYIQKHRLSRRGLADKMGVQHRTLNKYVNDEIKHPTLYFLTLLSGATNTDLITLITIVSPNEVKPINADIMRLAERINNLPGVYKEAVVTMIMNLPLKGADDSTDKNK